MLIAHEFFPELHEYAVPGITSLATSDIIEYAGLVNFDGIPKAILDHARYRGEQVDKAIKNYEVAIVYGGEEYALNFIQDQFVNELAEIEPYFESYRTWKHRVGFEVIHPVDESRCYMVGNYAVGATMDLIGIVIHEGVRRVAIVDVKTTSKLYGKKLFQKQLAWRYQLESYLMASEEDDEIWRVIQSGAQDLPTLKWILQLNPKFTDGYMVHPFEQDDRATWIGLTLSAFDKLEAGIYLEKR
jgi:hypothetical protein